LDRRLGGPQRQSERHAEEKILDPTGTRTPTPSVVQPVASHYTDNTHRRYEKRVNNCSESKEERPLGAPRLVPLSEGDAEMDLKIHVEDVRLWT
jgi:hypothetical protein